MTASEEPHALPFRSLARTLIRSIVAAAAVCTIAVATVQAVLTWHSQRTSFDAEVASIAQITVPLLSINLRDAEPRSIDRQLALIADRPQIAYVGLQTMGGQHFERGDPAHRNEPTGKMLDVPDPTGATARLGVLSLAPNTRYLYSTVLRDVLGVFASALLLTGLICGVVAIILRRQLQLPMQHIAEFAASLSPAELTRPLRLRRPPRRWRDEIDEVADGFRVLQDDIRNHVEALDREVAHRTAELERANRQLEALARRDPLTSLANRRRYDHEKVRAWGHMLSQQHPLSVLMIDIDFFKSYNDNYGHAAGDECLISIARLLGESFNGEGELAARLGGEEFSVLLERVGLRDAIARAEGVRRDLYALNLPHPKSAYGRVTISIGVSSVDPSELPAALSYDAPFSGIVELLGRADQALYQAKGAGRNRVMGLALWSRELA